MVFNDLVEIEPELIPRYTWTEYDLKDQSNEKVHKEALDDLPLPFAAS